MALSSEQRRALLKLDLPVSESVRERLNDYLARTGLHYADFARRINYSSMSLRAFIGGQYQAIAGNDKNLRAAICSFIQANPVGGATQGDDESEEKLYRTENVRLLDKYFSEALKKPLAYFVYGPPGTQKSFILKRLIEKLLLAELPKNGTGKRAYYVYCRQRIGPLDLMKRVAEAAGIPGVGNVDRIMRNMRFELRNRRALLCFDEAQHLSNDSLEVVRELLDEPPHCSLLFAGSHNLKQIFQQMELEQWRSRLHAGNPLPGISEVEAQEIVAAELGPQPEKKVATLIKAAKVADYRQTKNGEADYQYISARRLFWGIRDLKAALAEKEGVA
jgi:DNA transposition AAA+ family ATPase